MATVSRFSAVAKVGPLELGGFVAWVAWLLLHLVYLVGFKSKVTTFISWTTTFLTHEQGPAHHHRAADPRLNGPPSNPPNPIQRPRPHNTIRSKR